MSRPIREIEHVWIPLSDGTRLSARIWLPADAESDPVPAILEYLPYRKDDATAAGDAGRHPYFAEHGYAAVRVDIRGAGDSDGICLDEYLANEQDDALEVLAWLAAQPWCTGRCGMIGYSWGGFNGLQVAARRPPQLGAIVTMYSTDDRYADDCHYQGGCLLASDMLKWAEWMHALNARPADPRFVEDWRAQWVDRLRETPPYIAAWMAHPRYDEFWKHGSVCEDYAAITAATLVVGGWTDAYTNAVPRLLEHLTCPRAGIIGPWGHVVPSHGIPGPAIGFLQECVAWFDRWLKDVDNGADDLPLLRAYLMDPVPPASFYAERPGRWVAERAWPPPSVAARAWTLGAAGTLEPGGNPGMAAGSEPPARPEAVLDIRGDQTCGATAGVWCANGRPDELPVDQASDDALSLTFDSEPLGQAIDVLGRPVARLVVAADRPLALVSARLCDVAPDGTSALVTWGLLNLTHRDGHEHPEPLEPHRRYHVEIPLNAIGQRVEAGHRLRLALSPTYWPQAWPSPEPVTLSVVVDGPSTLELPVRAQSASEMPAPAFGPPVESAPLVGSIVSTGDRVRTVSRDEARGVVDIEDTQWARDVITATGTDYYEAAVERWHIERDRPLSARVECDREITIDRDGWHVRVLTSATQTCDERTIFTRTRVEAYEGDEQVWCDEQLVETARDLY